MFMEGRSLGRPKPLGALDPRARFSGVQEELAGPAVCDFWSWAFSDLRSNTTRGILAEFLVAWALGVREGVRAAWDDFDVLTPDGIRVEVKASGYLQSWVQKRPSRISFGRLTGRSWSAETGELGAERELRADVYVFAIHTCSEPECYDPLDLDAWCFLVLPRAKVEEAGSRSISLATLRSLEAEEVPISGLAEAVSRARKSNE
jgi:hypothetical protein